MFRIVCDPSSGSIKLYLTEIRSGSLMFVMCLIGVWQRNYAAKHRLRTRKISRVISVEHVQHSLMMDRKRSETCRSDF